MTVTIYHLPFTIYRLPFTIYHLSFTIMLHRLKYLNKWLFIFTFQFSLFNLSSSCTQADIHYRPTADLDGLVRIYPDVSVHTLPALSYHFYNTDPQQDCTVLPCDGAGNFDGRLSLGRYQAIGVNLNAANVDFLDIDNFELATAQVSRMEIDPDSRAPFALLAQPGMVYSVVPEGFEVVAGDTVWRQPEPRLLTRTVNLRFVLGPNLLGEATAMAGVIHGVYPSVNLSTGLCDNHWDENIGMSTVNFVATATTEGYGAIIRLFGMGDPDYGNNYTNTLAVMITLAGGKSETLGIDLTEALSDIIKDAGGQLPQEITLRVDLDRTPIGLDAVAVAWLDNEDSTEKKIYF